ncbi:MAG TPA: ATP-binding protein [Noviherbaspirillum sp.]|uniref:ATP-binding protein n=1 Tax=Noviherbaspirillum sp. TaxID=1926288 RepID=UPI002B45BEB1|nr:ATP-binding protein [Noviherbaspirillum sp.]HJV84406.1 ATP-binding protein [Noviherbaspirillum sp.]
MVFSFPERPAIARYTVAVLLGLVAAALHWGLQPWIGARSPFLIFLPALLITAMTVGRGPAFAVLVIGLINGALLLDPIGHLRIGSAPDRALLGAYMVAGLLLSFLGGKFRPVTHRAVEAEQLLALAQENAGVGLFEVDLVRRTMFASATLQRLLGHPPPVGSEARYLPLAEWNALFREEELAEARRALKEALAAKADNFAREHSVTLPDGQTRWLLTKTHIEKDASGRALRLRGASLDISERKRMVALLERTQSELKQQVADLQRLHVLAGRVLELNDLQSQFQVILEAITEFHGCRQGLLSLYDPERNCLVARASIGLSEHAMQLLATVEINQGACGLACGQRRRVVVEDTETEPCFAAWRQLAREEGFRAVHSTPLITASGVVMGVISVHLPTPRRPTEREMRMADICAGKASVFTERARAQAIAQASDQRFRVVLESSAVPFNVLTPLRDRQGGIVDFQWAYVNHAAARVVRRPVEALIGQRMRDTLPGTWDDSELFMNFVAVAEAGETREFEYHAQSNGIEGWYHIVASPLQGSVATWFADITERKLSEQALREADRRKDEFLATLAHELRNPLAPIRQAALISNSTKATEAQKRWSHGVIDRQVRHMSLLLDDLLDVSRITRGMLHLRMARTELSSVVESAVETARPIIDARQHLLRLDLPPDPVYFEADQLRVAQVLANLLTNAAKYTDPGGTIRLHAEAGPDELVISVIDNGIGIRPEALDDIFRMFTQVRSTQDRSSGGLGIGLALAKGLVELHGGSITASSAGPGQGSSFTVRLPVRASAAPEHEADGAAPPPPMQGKRVLVADDNRDAAETLSELLRLQGHEVRIAYDGESALSTFADFAPEVVLLDIGMPGMSGNEVAQRIRSMPQGSGTVLVAVTGWGQEKDKNLAFAAGFDHHLTKPIDLMRLRSLLEEPATQVGTGDGGSDPPSVLVLHANGYNP